MFGDMLMVQYDSDSESLMVMDQGGFIPLEDEFWTIVDLLARAYQRNRPERIMEHNEAIWAKHHDPNRERPKAAPKRKKPPEPGYVYVLEGNGTYKIGRAKDPVKRSELLAIQLPYKVNLLFTIPASNPRSLEADLHEHFADKRLNGEWFDLSPEDVAYIRGFAE